MCRLLISGLRGEDTGYIPREHYWNNPRWAHGNVEGRQMDWYGANNVMERLQPRPPVGTTALQVKSACVFAAAGGSQDPFD